MLEYICYFSSIIQIHRFIPSIYLPLYTTTLYYAMLNCTFASDALRTPRQLFTSTSTLIPQPLSLTLQLPLSYPILSSYLFFLSFSASASFSSLSSLYCDFYSYLCLSLPLSLYRLLHGPPLTPTTLSTLSSFEPLEPLVRLQHHQLMASQKASSQFPRQASPSTTSTTATSTTATSAFTTDSTAPGSHDHNSSASTATASSALRY